MKYMSYEMDPELVEAAKEEFESGTFGLPIFAILPQVSEGLVWFGMVWYGMIHFNEQLDEQQPITPPSHTTPSHTAPQILINGGLSLFFLYSFFLNLQAENGVLEAQQALAASPSWGGGAVGVLFGHAPRGPGLLSP